MEYESKYFVSYNILQWSNVTSINFRRCDLPINIISCKHVCLDENYKSHCIVKSIKIAIFLAERKQLACSKNLLRSTSISETVSRWKTLLYKFTYRRQKQSGSYSIQRRVNWIFFDVTNQRQRSVCNTLSWAISNLRPPAPRRGLTGPQMHSQRRPSIRFSLTVEKFNK